MADNEILQAIQAMRDELVSLRSEMQGSMQEIRKDNAALHNDMEALKKDTSTLHNDMEALKKDTSTLHNDLEALKKDTSTLHDDLESLKKDVIRIPVIEKNTQLVMESVQGTNEKFRRLDELEEKVDDIQTTVSVLKALTVKK